MISVEDYPILKNHMATLKETSKDSHGSGESFMTESLLSVINFDAVKDEYIKPLRACGNPKSNDALFIDSNGKATFIEFKNGIIDKQKQYDVRKKVYDSLLIFTDIVNQGISYTRSHMDYILVYNEERNASLDDDPKTRIQSSGSRDKIAKGFMSFGRRGYIKYGLEIFKNYCFQNVFTYTEEEFEINFVSKYL